jgi:hypothetical protein
MTLEDLEAQLGLILEIEERVPVDWVASQKRCLEIILRLSREREPDYPHEIVYHFLDDPDVRRKDDRYALHQRQRLRAWLHRKQPGD